MNANKLQIVLIGGAVFLTLIVVLIFTGIIPGLKDNSKESANLELWGFDDRSVWDEILRAYKEEKPQVSVTYKKMPSSDWEADILNAVASGNSPDIFILPSEYLKKFKDKISSAPPLLVTEREIVQQFVNGAGQFLTEKKEVFGIPLYADPLVLFYNKDLFNRDAIALPPVTWDEFLVVSQKLTKKSGAGNITISGAAMGRAKNIKNAPEILTALFLESGEKIVDEKNEVVLGELIRMGDVSLRPSESALRFFSEFADGSKMSHSWTPALPEAEDLFLAGKLGMYLGFSSEYQKMLQKNPHIAIGVAHLPSLNSKRATYGSVFAPAVPLASRNYMQSWQFIKFLTAKEMSKLYSDIKMSASPRRDLFSTYQSDPVRSVFAESNLSLEYWANPNPEKVDVIFRELIEDTAVKKDTMRALLERAANKIREINK